MTKDGQNSATADLNMGGNKLKNGKTATLVGDFPIVSDIQNAVHTYVTSTGSANAYVLTLTPAPAAYVAGQKFTFKANFANTGAATVNVNSLGAKDLERYGSIPLVTGEIRVDQIVTIVYDGTQFQTISINDVPVPVASKFGAFVVQNTADNGYELLSGQGTIGQIMTSNGADALPSFQDSTPTLQLLKTLTASTSASFSFVNGVDGVVLDGTFKAYIVDLLTIVPVTDSTNLLATVSIDAGSSFISSGYGYYREQKLMGTGTYDASTNASASTMIIGTGVGTGTGEQTSLLVRIPNPADAAKYKIITWDGGGFNDNGSGIGSSGVGTIPTTSAIDGLKFALSSDEILTGTAKLYGVL